MFLHYILNEDKNSLIYRCLEAQMRNPVRNDQILTVWKDFEELDIALDMETISMLSLECWSERSACAALGCWHKRRWPLF